MKPAPFEYAAPATLDEALALRAANAGECAVLAGGQSLVPALNLRLARPRLVLDVNAIEELRGIAREDGVLALGALTRQRAVERDAVVLRDAPLVAEALRFVAHPPIRVRGTIGGSLAHADPAAELPAVAVALDGELVLRSVRGSRTVAASAFFTGWFTTALEPDELLTEVRLPVLTGASTAFAEVARRHGEFALAGAAAVVRASEGVLTEVRVAVAGVDGAPVRRREAEADAVGAPASAETFRELAQAIASSLEPQSDIHASSAYRKRVAAVVIDRALAEAA